MKTTTPLSLTSLLLLVFTLTATADIVFDSDGDFLRNGGTYMLSPPNGGGGILAAAIKQGSDRDCSLGVIQHESYTGWPVTISALVRPTFISTSFQLLLSFAYIPPNVCTKNSDWIIKSSNDFEGNRAAVMLGDDKNPVGSLFFIKSYDSSKNYYKLVVCGGRGDEHCRNIGVDKDENGYKRLVVTEGEPLVLQFDKVNKGNFAFESNLSMVV
uniref:Trypsin inhibitor 1 n=1 Tax=Senna obtusifolia TaxID=346985 RepID=A0A097P6E1_9FABA|nr:trypsin inhibitor 1 [Senna obtusifolia]